MIDATLLTKVKSYMGITGDFHDDNLKDLITDVKNFMSDAGVSDDVLNNDVSVGCIKRGVKDQFYDGEYSNAFKMRLIQLTKKKLEE